MANEMEHKFFIQGAIAPETIAGSIANHSRKTNIGAHDIFLGQVRKDIIENRIVRAIDYSCYEPMAIQVITRIREQIITDYKLNCAHILHSMGLVEAGGISLFVLVSSAHRRPAFDACREMVERIKKEVPIFGKELFEDGSHQWKENID